MAFSYFTAGSITENVPFEALFIKISPYCARAASKPAPCYTSDKIPSLGTRRTKHTLSVSEKPSSSVPGEAV